MASTHRSADGAADRIAEPGMVLTIRYDATGETEKFLLGRRFGRGADITVYSTLSPLGHAVAGARPGEQRIYSIPNERRPVLVTLVEVSPYRRQVAEEPPTPSAQREGSCSSGIQLRETVGSRSRHRHLGNRSHAAQSSDLRPTKGVTK
jgi:hypothetical protein